MGVHLWSSVGWDRSTSEHLLEVLLQRAPWSNLCKAFFLPVYREHQGYAGRSIFPEQGVARKNLSAPFKGFASFLQAFAFCTLVNPGNRYSNASSSHLQVFVAFLLARLYVLKKPKMQNSWLSFPSASNSVDSPVDKLITRSLENQLGHIKTLKGFKWLPFVVLHFVVFLKFLQLFSSAFYAPVCGLSIFSTCALTLTLPFAAICIFISNTSSLKWTCTFKDPAPQVHHVPPTVLTCLPSWLPSPPSQSHTWLPALHAFHLPFQQSFNSLKTLHLKGKLWFWNVQQFRTFDLKSKVWLWSTDCMNWNTSPPIVLLIRSKLAGQVKKRVGLSAVKQEESSI